MKIVFVSQPLSTGGAERVIAALANRFHEIGHDVKIVVVDNGDSNVYYTHAGIEFIHIPKPSNPVYDLFYRAKVMRQYFNEYKPDIILPFTTQKNVSVLLATLFTDHTVIISERNNPYLDPKNKALRILRKMLYFTADGFVFQTDGAKAYFSKKIQVRSCVIANPLSDNLPVPWASERRKTIVMVNRLDPQKNLKMAIDAFAEVAKKYPDYNLEIFGKGPLQGEITEYVESMHLESKVFLRGFCKNVCEKIVDARIYLMTSDFEGMSNSLMEALAIGLPCISTDHPTGGAKALIRDHENGILIPVRDIDACVTAILELIEDEDLCCSLSDNSAKLRDELTVEHIANQWLSYINSIIKS